MTTVRQVMSTDLVTTEPSTTMAETVRAMSKARVGSALVHGSGFDHTADIVRVNGKDLAKTGRHYIESDRLHPVEWKALVEEADWISQSS